MTKILRQRRISLRLKNPRFNYLRFRISNLFRILDFGFWTSRASRGFGMIEVLIAIFIITMGVVAGFTAIIKALTVVPVVRQDLVAARLAEEGIEMARNVRDGTLLQIANNIKQGIAPNSPDCVASPPCDGDRWEEDLLLTCGGGPTVTATRLIVLEDQTDFNKGIGNPAIPGMELRCPTGGISNMVCQHDTKRVFASRTGGGGDGCPGAPWLPTQYRRQIEVMYRTDSNSNGNIEDDPFVYGVNATDCNRTATPCWEARVRVYVWWSGKEGGPDEPCPGRTCVLLEDRLTNWTDYLQSFL